MVQVKICGLKTADAVDAAVNAGADLVGFVFFKKSPRHVTPAIAGGLAARVPVGVLKVGLTVDATNDELAAITGNGAVDILQLHGVETPERVAEVRRKFGLPAGDTAAQVLRAPVVRDAFQAVMDRLWAEGTGSATRPAAALLMAEPPSIDRGEVTDKGSINQRAVMTARAELVEDIYAEPAPAHVLVAKRG